MKYRSYQYKLNGKLKSDIDIIKDAYDFAKTIPDEETRRDYLNAIKEEFQFHRMNQNRKSQLPITIIGVVFIGLLIFISIKFPTTIQQYFSIYKTILAIACAGVAALIPGFFNINYQGTIRAGGALGVFTLIFIFLKPAENTFNVRVIVVEGKNVKLDKNGKVVMYLGLEPRESFIHEHNDALFENIPIIYLNTIVKFGAKFSQNIILENPDSLFILDGNNIIYINTALPLNNIVSGRVIYKDVPLEGVEVSIGELTTMTNKSGFYKLILDKTNLQSEQTVSFFKQNYKLIRKRIFLESLDNLDMIMEK
jgi:hypothetical protein